MMNNEFYAVIDASNLFAHKGVEGYRVVQIFDTEKESLDVMHSMMNPKNGNLFNRRPKIHRSVVGRKEMESHMMLMEVIAVPTNVNPDNPQYEFIAI